MTLSPRSLALALSFLLPLAVLAGEGSHRWFPIQRLPTGLVRTAEMRQWPSSSNSLRIMVQSVAGLAGKSVNEGKGDELVWVTMDNADVEAWGKTFSANHPEIKDRGTFGPWELVERFADKKIVNGYILYKADASKEEPKTKERPGIDNSVNIATSLAGIFGGIVLEERLEKEAKKRGLKLLFDARDKSQQWCFDQYKDRFNRRMLTSLDPKIVGSRDYAITHNTFTFYGTEEPATSAMAWAEPSAPILGWIAGDEFKATRLATIYGHFQTASSLIPNLTVLSAGTHEAEIPKVPHLDPKQIDWNDNRSTISFFCSDGDNVTWAMNAFYRGTPYYWNCPACGKISFGWGMPLAHLVQLGPQPLEYALQTRTPNDWFVEWHGGYYYPDLFASERPNRWELLAGHARDTWEMMKKAGTNMIGFNVRHLDSPDAQKAYEVIASQMDGMLAILAFEYSPYNAGAGKVYWVKDARGREIPVITLRYQIWWQLKNRKNAGTPAKAARFIRDSIAQATSEELPRNDWAMVHAWSYFKEAPGMDELAEELPPKRSLSGKEKFEDLGGVRGYLPAVWCAERLPDTIRIVSPEEMAWRIRMKHNPEETKKVIAELGH